jgi:hypothetical protein
VDGSNPEDEGAVPPADDSGYSQDSSGPGSGGPGSGAGPLSDLPPEWAALVIPDDVSSLAAEIATVRAELTRERRSRRLRRLLHGALPPPQQHTATVPMLGFLVLVLTAVTCLVIAVLPAGAPLRRPVPLAATTVPAGHDGGLLPDVQLVDERGTLFPARDVRPGVVLLVGDTCDCAGLIAEYASATAEARVRLLVVGDTRLPRLPAEGVRGRVIAATDPAGRVRYSLDPPSQEGPRAVLVGAAGVISWDIANARDVVRLRSRLASLS